MKGNTEDHITITDPTEDRYASLRLIDWWQQERIGSARIMVVGAGALGNEVLKNLALLGVGHIFIVDFDVIESSNLTRSVLFRSQDGGLPKANVAAQRVQSLNNDVKVIAFAGDVIRDLGLGVYRRMDVVISCLDNRAARLAVNAACCNVNKPWVDGALDVFNGMIQAFLPPNSPCYECMMTEQDYRFLNIRYSCPPGFVLVTGQQPTIPTTASIIGSMQVQETIKILYNMPVQPGKAVYYSGETMRLSHIQHPRREDCPAHNPYESIVCLPSRASELTLAQCMQVIRSHIQEEGIVYLPRSIVTSFYCSTCNEREEVYRPHDVVVPGQVPCPSCGLLRKFDVTSVFATDDERSHLPVPLTQLGVPELHILPVQSKVGWHYFELSSDEQHIFHDWIS